MTSVIEQLDTTDLAAVVAGPVLTPGMPGYDLEVMGFNVAHHPTPAVVVGAVEGERRQHLGAEGRLVLREVRAGLDREEPRRVLGAAQAEQQPGVVEGREVEVRGRRQAREGLEEVDAGDHLR